jgi:hypothetical protein
VKLNERRYKKDRQFTQEQQETIREFAGSISHFISFADQNLLANISPEDMAKVEAMKKMASTMRKKFNKSAMKRMSNGDLKLEMLNIDINNHFDAVSNHALHIVQASKMMHEEA